MSAPVEATHKAQLSVKCHKCEKQFTHPCRLRRHLEKKTECRQQRSHGCECGKTYVDRHSLYRHRKLCIARRGLAPTGGSRAQPIVIQNIQNIHNTNVHVNALGQNQTFHLAAPAAPKSAGAAPSPTIAPPAGWPAKWPIPAVTPNPFSPPGFGLSLEQLTAAVEALPESVREACRRGDQTAVVQLLMGILRQIHADPLERNVYMNPRRGDQALIYIPEHWVTCQLDEAGQAMFRRIAEVLGCLPRQAPPSLRTVATAARQSCAASAPELARASRAVLSAHLENVRHASAAGADWLGLGADEAESLAFFGQEWTTHLQSQVVAAAAEASSQLYEMSQVTEGTGPAMASLALAECARYLIHGHTSNLTMLPRSETEVYVHSRLGWEPRSRESATMGVVARLGWIMTDLLSEVDATPLSALNPWFGERHAELMGQESVSRIMLNYLSAAARYYGALSPRPDAHDRREAARRILQASAPSLEYEGRAILRAPALTEDRPQAPPPRRAQPMERPVANRALTDAEVEELLGW